MTRKRIPLEIHSQSFSVTNMEDQSLASTFIFNDVDTEEDYDHILDFLIFAVGKERVLSMFKKKTGLMEAFE